MKIRLIIILTILTAGNLFPQNILELNDYRLKDYKFEWKGKSNQFPYSPNATVVTPITSKYPISNFITDIIFKGDTVWFATGTGIMRTLDNFNSFQYYYGLQPFGEDDVSGLIVLSNLVVVTTATTQEVNSENVAVGTGVKVSTDYGHSWNAFGQPLDGLNDTVIVYGSNNIPALPVVVPQQNLSYDIAVTRNKDNLNEYVIWITSFAGGLRKSTDYGTTWQRVLLPPDNLDSIYIGGTGYNFALDVRQNLNHRVFTVEALNDSTLFVGSANGINRSTDWGVSWRKYNYLNSGFGNNRVAGNFVVNFHIQKYSNKTILWAATRRAENPNEANALSYTTDGGFTWAYTLSGPSPNGISSYDKYVYGLTDDGLLRSEFGVFFDWVKTPLIYDEVSKDVVRTSSFYSGNYSTDTVYFGSADGLIRTIETGNPWSAKWKIFRAIKEIDLSSETKSYAAPNPFAPSTEVVRIFFKTGKPASQVTIKIFDFGMNPVRTVIQNATRNSPDELFTIWDGKNDNGIIVANGVYFYRIAVDDDKYVWGKILVLQ
ncbi:MAG: hypothetical protein JW917_02240 [Ignavibacteria bacterium]|nr:hypothetical protein [Ignavibacteria bacterium]